MLSNPIRSTLAEKAYDNIKSAIFNGEVAPGALLSENRLAQQLGMSRTPVREALRTLENEGWVRTINGVGTFVSEVSVKDVKDLFEVRCLLETFAARTAIFAIREEEIEALEQKFRHVSELLAASPSEALSAFEQTDWEFHSMLIERASNRYLKTMTALNTDSIRRYQMLASRTLNNLSVSTRQHLDLLQKMRSRDVEAFCQALQEHIQSSVRFLPEE